MGYPIIMMACETISSQLSEEMLNDIIITYRCLLLSRQSLPGVSLENVFPSNTIHLLEREYKWLLQCKEKLTKQKE